jgi:hypothetical protein
MSDIPYPDTPQPDIPAPPLPDMPTPVPEVEPDPGEGPDLPDPTEPLGDSGYSHVLAEQGRHGFELLQSLMRPRNCREF